MTVTILAAAFLAGILLIAFIGLKLGTKPMRPSQDPNSEKCSLCRQKFNKALLVERTVGDYKLLYFCHGCISALHNEIVSKN